jgi:hypothetical protein
VKSYPKEIQKEIDAISGNNSANGYQQEFIFLLSINYPLYYLLSHMDLKGYQIKYIQCHNISTHLQELHKLLENNNFELSESIESQLEHPQQVDLYNRIKKAYFEESKISYTYKDL